MSVPNHRPGCQTKTFPTNCQYCGDQVYYFSCSCGSKVYFQNLGWPWELHQDYCPSYRIEQMILGGVGIAQIRRTLESEANRKRVSLTSSTKASLEKWEEVLKKNRNAAIVDILPRDEPVGVTGVILEINQVNFYKRLLYPETDFARQILGILEEETFLEIKLREDFEPGEMIQGQYSFFVRQSDFDLLKLGVGKRLYAYLKMHEITGEHTPIWLSDTFDRD